MKASVRKTASSGVDVSIQRPAAAWGRLMTTAGCHAWWSAIRPGEIAQTARTAAIAGRGQRATSHAARIAAAIHIIWKYLFMSKSTSLTRTTFGTRKRATSQAARNPRCGTRSRAAQEQQRGDREQDRQAEVGDVEEGDGRRPVGRVVPRSSPRRTGMRPPPPGGRGRQHVRQRHHDRGQEQHGVAEDRPRAPRARRERRTARRSGRPPGTRGNGTARAAPRASPPAARPRAGDPGTRRRAGRPRPGPEGRRSSHGAAGTRSPGPRRCGRTASRRTTSCRTGSR